MKEIGRRILEIRKNLSLTQREFAEHLGVSMGSIQAYESGKLPKGEILKSLSGQGYDLNWLFTGQGQMKVGQVKPVKPYDIELERMLIWNVAYYMCKRTEAAEDAEVFADTFMEIFELMKAKSDAYGEANGDLADADNVIDFTLRRLNAK